MPVRKSDSADLRKRYTIFVQLGLVASLIILVILFTVDYTSNQDFQIVEEQQEIVQVEEIEQTRQIEKPPPPPKPPAPVEVPDEDIDEQIDLDLDMDLDLNDAPTDLPPPPPPPPDEPEPEPEPEPEIFVIVENPPELIGGLEGLQGRIQYPELARRAGIEGTVFVQFVVDEQGNVVDPVCVRDPGGQTCEEALRAVRVSKFKPGRQRGKPVKVRFSLPVKFRLR
ncbi:MAG: energy transducer TonB [Rhodothermales bacterium]